MQDQVTATLKPKRVPWNKGKLTGAKPPLRSKQVWSIRTKLQIEDRTRDLAMFNLAIDSKLGGSNLAHERTLCPWKRTFARPACDIPPCWAYSPGILRPRATGHKASATRAPGRASPAGGTPPRPAERRPAAFRREAAGLFACFVSSLVPKRCELRLSIVRRLTFRVWASRRTHLAKRA
jgi:hypothetical protein